MRKPFRIMVALNICALITAAAAMTSYAWEHKVVYTITWGIISLLWLTATIVNVVNAVHDN